MCGQVVFCVAAFRNHMFGGKSQFLLFSAQKCDEGEETMELKWKDNLI